MNKKDLTFIAGLTLFMGVLWMIVEIIVGIWIPVFPSFHKIWLIAVVAATLIISVWHAFKYDENDPKVQKYEKKRGKRKK